MAIAPIAYATAAEYRSVIGKSDEAQDTDINQDLQAISRHIDGKLGRFFGKDEENTARIYTIAEASPYIWIDDLSESPESIQVDTNGDGTFETTVEPGDYNLLPLNADKGPEARPWTRVELSFPGQRVEITGKWGWPAVPAAIKRATIHLTAILRLETPRATRRIAELGESIEASPDAQSIIRQLTDAYKRYRYI